jgi:molybdopterin converting factor small subunit
MVRLLLFAGIREHIKLTEIYIQCITIQELLNKLKYTYPEITNLINTSVISVNQVIMKNLDYKFNDNDQVAIIPPISSG